MRMVVFCLAAFFAVPASAQHPGEVEALFSPDYRNGLVMRVEAALAGAQAEAGVIDGGAAQEIERTATIRYAPTAAVDAEYEEVRHRMVALLNVWRRSLSPEARKALHYGATTVDIYDTVRILQMRDAIGLMRADLLEIEAQLVTLAAAHRDTVMIGRTLGQHALPITFGKKVAVWAGANRRNIDRLNEAQCALGQLGVMRGAVGTHLGLGDQGAAIEMGTARRLGLGPVAPADWHGMRDVFADYAATLAIMARTHAAIGQEVFTLQMTDIGEVVERRAGSAVSSSTMPHKVNPSRSEALMHWGRVIPAMASVLMDDVANVMERDNTSRPNRTLEQLTIDSAEAIDDLSTLLDRLEIDEQRMRTNIDRTDGMVMAQRIVFAVQGAIGKQEAEERVAAAARAAIDSDASFRNALLADAVLAPHLANIDALLDPTTYVGDAGGQVDRTIAWLRERSAEPACD